MPGPTCLPRAALALLLAALSSGAGAQAVAPAQNAIGRSIILRPLELLKIADLDFGTVTVSAAGTAVLDPASGAVTTTGGITHLGDSTQAASFAGAASRNSPVIIRLPRNPISLTRVGGTETMTLSDWTLDGPATRHVDANRAFNFNVGGTLIIAANQADGTYVGTFDITVQYP